MNILLFTGDHPRHLWIASIIQESGLLGGVVVQEREGTIPQPPNGISAGTRDLYIRHFADRMKAEEKFFGGHAALQADRILRVPREELNSPMVQDFVRRIDPQLLLSYGVHLLSDETLACATGHRWNIHGGLSPWYRGAATHFWPSYFLEPQFTGITVHELRREIDAGPIVHQCLAPLVPGDGVHDLACRAVSQIGQELPELLTRAIESKLAPTVAQRTTGRLWRDADWRPEHLHIIYDLFGNRIVDRYLSGEFVTRSPKVIRQF